MGKAFSMLRSRAAWGFQAGTSVARLALASAVAVIAYLLIPRLTFLGVPANLLAKSGGATQGWYSAVVWVGALLTLPVSLIALGGMLTIASRTMDGAELRARDGWFAGGRTIGRVFLLQLLAALLIFVVIFVAVIPVVLASFAFFAVIPVAAASVGPAGFIVAACFGYAFMLVVLVFGLLFAVELTGIAECYAVIGGRRALDALSSAWKAMRARPKDFLVFGLILIGLGVVTVAVYGGVLLALNAALHGGRFVFRQTATLGTLLRDALVINPVSYAITVPYAIFNVGLMAAFFRALTGIDAPPAPAYAQAPEPPAYPPYPEAPVASAVDESASGWVASPQGEPHDPTYPPPVE